MRLSFIKRDDISVNHMLASIYCGERVVGKVWMDWEHWPFQSRLIGKSPALMAVIDRFAEIGRMIRKKERTLGSKL
jgi:hypothetical protein